MARHETTVAEFRRFVVASSYKPQSVIRGESTIYDEASGILMQRSGVTWESDHAGDPAADELPVVHVGWEDAAAYARWLSAETGKKYRLPTEAEFEYALRGGTTTRYWWGDSVAPAGIENLAGELDSSPTGRLWANAFAGYRDGYWGASPVGMFRANPFGVNDLNGNVSEWVEDCWHEDYRGAPTDGSAWVEGGCIRRVIRGASWASTPQQTRSAFRLNAANGTTNPRLGFRVVRE